MRLTDAQVKRKLELERLLLKIDAPNMFYKFIPYINVSYTSMWFHKAIADHCQMLLDGKIKNLMVFMPPQHGKALEIQTPILTANRGWVEHGSLCADDYVFAPNGKRVKVEAVTCHYLCECSEIRFADGQPIIAANQHEWGCYIPNASHKPVYYPKIETQEITAKMIGRSPYLESSSPLIGEARELPIPPYLLGLWLGDGASRHKQICKSMAKRLKNKETKDRQDKRKHFIQSIMPCSERMVNCIQVEGGYYLAGKELRPTHNSEIISRNFPAYALGRNPNLKIVGTSYSANLAEQFSRSIQRIIDSKEYQAIFPNTYLNGSNVRTDVRGYIRNVDAFEMVGNKGFYKAVGVGGSLTGTPVDIAIIDDPVKDALEAYSPIYRERVWDWYTSVLLTRLHNDSKQLFIMTRWHDDDLAGRILKREADKWKVLSIPAIRETLDDGNNFDSRKVGEALWPKRHSLERLLDAQRRSPRFFSALYQQHPSVEGGNIIKEAWFNHISLFEFKKKRRNEAVTFFVDTAYTEKTTNDPTGILGSCMIGNNIYIVCAKKVNMKFPELCRFLPSYVRDNGYGEGSSVRIEPKANGISVIDQLYESTDLNVVSTPSPKESKETRLNAASPYVESGRVYLVGGDWNDTFIDEVCGFPAKPHDEFVDLLCYSLDYHHKSFNELSDEEILRDFL